MAVPGLLSVLFLGLLIWRGRNERLTLELPEPNKPDMLQTVLLLLLLALNTKNIYLIFDILAKLCEIWLNKSLLRTNRIDR